MFAMESWKEGFVISCFDQTWRQPVLNKYSLVADAYLKSYRQASVNETLLKAIDAIMQEPLEGLYFVEALVEKSVNDAELAYIAAGPFEDLFIQHYEMILNPLDQMLRKNIKMRKALSGIWVTPSTKARNALETLLGKYRLKYASL